MDEIGGEVASDLTGEVIDSSGVVVSAGEDGGAHVAIGFRAKKSNGKYKYFWLNRVKFGIPATNLATEGDSITFSTPTIEGTILCCNKADGEGQHPWKAEVTEGDPSVAAETIANWYEQVYDPAYAAVTGEGYTARRGDLQGCNHWLRGKKRCSILHTENICSNFKRLSHP